MYFSMHFILYYNLLSFKLKKKVQFVDLDRHISIKTATSVLL